MSTIAPRGSRNFGAKAPHISATTSDRGPGIARRLRSLLAVVVAGALVACGGAGGGGGGGGGGDGNPGVAGAVRGRVALGGLGGATVSMYRVGDYGDPIATTTSSEGATAAEIGRFTFPLPAAPSNAVFLFVVSGGFAHDVDEDGVLDGPTGNVGTIHALATTAQLEQQEIRISAVTEVVYQRALYFLRARYDDAYLGRFCDSWAGFVLRESLAGGAGIGNEDALAFDPLLHGAATYRPYVPHFRSFVTAVLSGLPLIEPALELSREQIHFEDFGGPVYGVALAGNVAYQCHGAGGLDIRSVVDPTDAPLLSNFGMPGVATEVQVVGGALAYVADGTGGLRIVDVGDPAAPVSVAALPTAAPVVSVHVVADRAYLCSDGAAPKLHIVDVTTPAAATVLSETPLAAAGTTVRVVGDFAYVLEAGRLEVFAVADPAHPVSQGTLPTQSGARIDVGSGRLFLADDTHFETFSLAAPATPLSIATLPFQGYGSYGLRVRGTRAFAMRGGSGVDLVDVSDPAHPSFLGVVATSGSAVDADMDAGLCVVSDGTGGLSIVGAGTPPPSAVVASVPWTNGLDSVYAVANRVYASTNRPTQFVVFDTSNPLAPVQIGSVDLASGSGRQIAVFGDVAFVGENSGLHAYSLADNTAPVHLGGADAPTAYSGVGVGPGFTYAVRGEGVDVFDVSDPTHFALITTLPLGGTGQRIVFDGSTLGVAAGFQGLRLYDATTPTDPRLQGTVPISSAIDVLLRAPFAFVSQYTNSTLFPNALRIVDYSVPSAPAIVRTLPLPCMVDRLSRSGDLLYASASVAGVNVVDVSTPGSAFHVANLPVPANIRDIAANEGWVYVADGFPDGALKVLRGAQTDVP